MSMEKMIGRKEECEELRRRLQSPVSEFVVIYGRRRIGKTYLVRRFFADKYSFSYVGIRGVTQQQQLAGFATALRDYGGVPSVLQLNDWFQAFDALRHLLERQRSKKKRWCLSTRCPG